LTEIKYKVGDLFADIDDEDRVMIAHCCNNLGRMGSGFVVPLMNRWPHVRDLYIEWHQRGKWQLYSNDENSTIPFELGQTQFLRATPTVLVANMIGQDGVIGPNNPHPLRYDAIEACIKSVGENASNQHKLMCPRFGAGLAGGKWEKIEPMIKEHWCQRNLDVTIYSI